MRSEHQRRVETFMRLAGQDVPETPCEPSEAVRLLRARLILEEALETIRDGLGISMYVDTDSGLFSIGAGINDVQFEINRPFDMTELIDGCADVSVVTIGTLSACGIPDEPFLREVDANNIEKIAFGSTDEHGKFKKHPEHKPPRIAEILESLA